MIKKPTVKTAILAAAITVVSLSLAASDAGASASARVKKGDKMYRENKFGDAVKEYDEALAIKPDDPIIQYNRASALYRAGDFAKAFDSYMASFGSGEKAIEAKALYNAGNGKFRVGEAAEKTNPASALSAYKEAAGEYKKTTLIAPDDEDAKYNYEFTMEKIRKLEEEMKKNEEKKQQKDNQEKDQNDKNQGQGGQGKDQNNKKDKQADENKKDQQNKDDKENENEPNKEDQEKQDVENKKDQQKQEEKKKKDEKEQQEKEDEKKKNEEKKQGAGAQDREDKKDAGGADGFQNGGEPDTMEGPSGAMTMEEADMMLRGQEEEESRLRGELREKKAAGRPKVLKNW